MKTYKEFIIENTETSAAETTIYNKVKTLSSQNAKDQEVVDAETEKLEDTQAKLLEKEAQLEKIELEMEKIQVDAKQKEEVIARAQEKIQQRNELIQAEKEKAAKAAKTTTATEEPDDFETELQTMQDNDSMEAKRA